VIKRLVRVDKTAPAPESSPNLQKRPGKAPKPDIAFLEIVTLPAGKREVVRPKFKTVILEKEE
jgi:hypothetical protein